VAAGDLGPNCGVIRVHLGRRSDASSNAGTHPLEVARIPGENVIGTRLQSTSRNERIIDGSSDDLVRGGIPNSCEVNITVKADEAEPAANAIKKLDRLVWSDPMRRRNTCERGVHLRQAVRGAKCRVRRTTRVKPKAVGVVRVIGQKDGKEYRRVEEQFHLKGSEHGEFPFAAD
jgi:hypothetical protein